MRQALTAFFLLLFSSAAALAQAGQGGSVPARAVSGFIKPAYLQLEKQAAAMAARADTLCADPGPEALGQARQAFAHLVDSWSQVEFLRFGPAREENRLEAIFFFPDRRGIGLRQVQGVLAERDESAASADTLAAKSVALQGLGALEFILYGTGAQDLAGPSGDFRCRFAQAVAANLARLSAEISEAWQSAEGIADRLSNPDPSHGDYRSVSEALREVLGALSHGAEAIKDQKIAPVLRGDRRANPKRAPFWRAGLTAASLRANFEGLRRLYEVSGIGAGLDDDQAWIAENIAFAFENAERALAKIPPDFRGYLKTKAGERNFAYLGIVAANLARLLAVDLSGALGLSAGFSSMDGD